MTSFGKSVIRDQMAEQTDIPIAHCLTELKRLQMVWSSIVLVTPFIFLYRCSLLVKEHNLTFFVVPFLFHIIKLAFPHLDTQVFCSAYMKLGSVAKFNC